MVVYHKSGMYQFLNETALFVEICTKSELCSARLRLLLSYFFVKRAVS